MALQQSISGNSPSGLRGLCLHHHKHNQQSQIHRQKTGKILSYHSTNSKTQKRQQEKTQDSQQSRQ